MGSAYRLLCREGEVDARANRRDGTRQQCRMDRGRARVLLDVCEELDRAPRSISDDLWARLTCHFSSAQILEIIALVGFYRTVSLYANALRLPLEPYAARFPATP